jgi:hypothetical protein
MKRSTDRILTSHCGSLPGPRELLVPLHAKDSGDAQGSDNLAQQVRASVAQVVRKQADFAIDVVNDGEHSKSSFAARTRIGGLERTNDSCAIARRPRATRSLSPACTRKCASCSRRGDKSRPVVSRGGSGRLQCAYSPWASN